MTPGSDEFPQREPIGSVFSRQHPVWNQLITRPAFSSRDILLDHSKSRLSEYALPALDLCDAAIHEKFDASDVAGVVGCEKHHGLRDFIGCTESAERNSIGNHLLALFAHL
jgi:hypothetical protein